jgi:hypothetical protein
MTVLYAWTVSGITVNTHYCGGKISSVSFSFWAKTCGCGDEMPGDCCKDSQQSFRIQDSHQAVSKVDVTSKQLLSPCIFPAPVPAFLSSYQGPEEFQNYIPPLLATRHFIENCVFLI